MALLPAHPGEALWIGGQGGQNHYNVGIGQGTSGGSNHTDFGQAAIEDGYTDPNKFFLNAEGNVVFRINASAGRTSANTAHPRSELRELLLNGSTKAAWDGRSGVHYAKGRCRIIEVTNNRPWICFGQIHGSEGSPITSDLLRLQTEGNTGATTGLSIVARRSPVSGGEEIRTVLRTGYDVGEWFSWEIRCEGGRVKVLLDGQEVLNVSDLQQNLNYFKAGCYLQDNVEKGASSSSWGAVEYERGSFVTWHTGTPNPTTPVFTGGTDPGGGAGGGDGTADTAAPTVPQNGVAVRGNNQLALSWSPSTDNIGVDHYNVYRFDPGGGGAGGGSEFTVGKTSSGSATTLSTADKMVASRFVAGESGTLTEGRARVWLDSSGSTLSKMVVYADSGGSPGPRLATSDQITISTTSEGVRSYLFTGANKISLVDGTAYWVAVAWDDPGTPSLTFSRGGASGERVESTATYGTPPNPFGSISATLTGPVDAWLIAVTGTAGGGGTTTTSFGKTSNGSSSTASSTDKVAASLFTATADGTLTAGHARCWMSATGSTTVRMVVCSNVGGAPGTFLAVSDALTVSSTSEAVRDFTFSGANQITISDGVDYWIGLAWDDPGTPSLTYSRDVTAGLRVETGTFAFPPAQGGSWGTPTTGLAGPIDVWVDVSSSSSGAGYVLDGTTTGTSYTDTGLTNGTEYSYVITAEDAAGNESAQSAVIKGTPGPPDTTAPSVPTGLAAVAGDGKVTLTWNASTDADSGMLRSTVYIGGAFFAHVDANATTATTLVVTGLTNGSAYSFRVSATDRALNESAQSAAATATPQAPPVHGAKLLPAVLDRAKVEVAAAWGADLTADEATWTWTDITADVRQDPGISTSLGRNDESSTSNPATLSLILDNRSGDYSLGGRSRRWPYVRRNTPVRVRIDPGDGRGGRVVLQGGADGWTPGWDLTGQIPTVTLSVSGTLRRLAQGSSPVQAVYRRTVAATSTVRAYWPLEEGSRAAYGAVLRGGSNMASTGRIDWAADTTLLCSAPLPQLGKASLAAAVAPYASTGQNQVRWLMVIPDGGLPDGVRLATISLSGTVHKLSLTYEIDSVGAHCLRLSRHNPGDDTLVSVTLNAWENLLGFVGRVSLELAQAGADIAWTMRLTSAELNADGRLSGRFVTGALPGYTAGGVTGVALNPLAADADLVIGHVTVQDALTGAFTESEALSAYETEFAAAVDSRLVRLCRENSIPLQRYSGGGVATDLEQMGPQLSAPLLDLLRECEAVDQGQLWDGRSAGLQYTTRRRREQGTVALTVDAAAGELADPFDAVDDDQRTRNRVQVTRARGVTVAREDVSGPLGTATVGVYDDSVTINNRNDSMARQYASWLVALGTVEGYRYPSVTVDLSAAPHLAGRVLDVIPGDRIDITGLDTTLAGFPTSTVSLVVEGIAHEISPHRWRATFRCSPFAPWAVGRVAAASGDTSDMVLRCDTDGSTLAAAAGQGATTLSVASSGVRWTTTADDYPLLLNVGGVRVRATACTGTSSPQTFTVDPLPVAKASGAPVRLWEPRRIGLG